MKSLPPPLGPLSTLGALVLALAACSDPAAPVGALDALDTRDDAASADTIADTEPDLLPDTVDLDALPDTPLDTSADAEPDLIPDSIDAEPDLFPDTLDVSDATRPDDAFSFEPITVEGLVPLWGAITAGGLYLGGVDGAQKVHAEIHRGTFALASLSATQVATQDAPRYCHCALHDASRGELLVIGGRGSTFADVTSVTLIDLTTGTSTPIAHDGAAEFPVGCAAFFSPPNDRGYVFGGLSSTQRAFTPSTFRWDPVARTFTKLAALGPSARYDAAVHVLDSGDALLLGGMGLANGAPTYPMDVWRFNAERELWREVPIEGPAPPGRRYAWTSLSPDESLLLFGYGSDSPNGTHVLDDLWQLDLTSKTWATVPLEGPRPKARGFAPNWQLGDDAGILAFGIDAATRVLTDAFVLRVPAPLRGRWH